jgi:hypothetical protein
MIPRFLGSSAGLVLAFVAVARGHAQSADSSISSVATTTAAPAADYDAAQDPAAIGAAETLGLSEPQRQAFFENVDAAAHYLLNANPSGGRPAIDSALGVVIRETSRKLRFLRQARLLFGEMYQRRAGDDDRAPGTEDELWRSPRNVSGLIELYRKNPSASDPEMERAMAPSFRAPR